MLLCLLFACAVQESPASQTARVVDLQINVPLNRPLLVDLKRVIDCKLDVTVVGKKTTLPMQVVDDWRFVDVHTLVKDDSEKSARQFLRAFSTYDGHVTDPELNGLRVDLTLDKGEWTLATADERAIKLDHLNDIIAQAPAISLWVALPKETTLDAPFEVQLVHLLRTALDAGADLEAQPAQLRIESWDDATKTARVVGSVNCTLTESLPAGAIKLTCELAVLLEIDLADLRLRHARFDGKATATSQGLMDVVGGGKVTIEMKSTTGEAATAAMREKPKYRQALRRLSKEGIEFTAPSYWFVGSAEPEGQVIGRSLSDASGIARLLVTRTRDPFDHAAMLASMRKTYPDAKVESSSNPLGKSVRFALDVQGLKMAGDMCALDADSTITIKLIAPPTLFDDSLKEFEAMRKTLKRLKKE